MKIGVFLKQVPDTESKIRAAGDGSGIESGDVKWIVSPYDEFAVEAGLQLKEKSFYIILKRKIFLWGWVALVVPSLKSPLKYLWGLD